MTEADLVEALAVVLHTIRHRNCGNSRFFTGCPGVWSSDRELAVRFLPVVAAARTTDLEEQNR